MKNRILLLLTTLLTITSCKVLKRENSVKPAFEIFNDTISDKLYIGSENIEYVNKKDLENFMKIKISGGNEKILNGNSVQFIKNNKTQNSVISIYSKNLIKENTETTQYWKTSYKNSITHHKENKYFHIKKNEEIKQTINFSPFNFSKKHLVFIGNSKAEKFVKQSITGQPYLWGYQIGNFKKDDWVFMQSPHNVRTSDIENNWEKIYIVNELLNDISSVYVKMSLGLRKDESKGDAKATLTNLNLRIFNSKEDAMFYIENIFKEK
ncbi:hypothetical protein FHR24_003096 [Wenyingzhuangia heitensis]|uniref:Lipoprotein n=1 Tax=Wenyingzhuangia heitensis TaxID=1487859 RepID=A0ABX0UHE0_9FLAO|nr:hypothetical protein [Wenyingzhuangia heitensis]NIJ46606.1 hypothetical protein [Wenyingzhuangia heitensis]